MFIFFCRDIFSGWPDTIFLPKPDVFLVLCSEQFRCYFGYHPFSLLIMYCKQRIFFQDQHFQQYIVSFLLTWRMGSLDFEFSLVKFEFNFPWNCFWFHYFKTGFLTHFIFNFLLNFSSIHFPENFNNHHPVSSLSKSSTCNFIHLKVYLELELS